MGSSEIASTNKAFEQIHCFKVLNHQYPPVNEQDVENPP